MNRSKKYNKPAVQPDPKYGSVLVHKLINKVMLGGEKNTASKIVYKVLEKLSEKLGTKDEPVKPYEVVNTVIDKVKPKVYLRSKRIASRVYKVPMQITNEKACSKALIWIINGARARSEHTFEDKLFFEMLNIIKEEKGNAIKKRDDYHRIAKENEAFIHYV